MKTALLSLGLIGGPLCVGLVAGWLEHRHCYHWRRATPAPSLPGEQPGGETRKPLVRARYPLTPGQANVSLEDDDGSPALPGERADEEGE